MTLRTLMSLQCNLNLFSLAEDSSVLLDSLKDVKTVLVLETHLNI